MTPAEQISVNQYLGLVNKCSCFQVYKTDIEFSVFFKLGYPQLFPLGSWFIFQFGYPAWYSCCRLFYSWRNCSCVNRCFLYIPQWRFYWDFHFCFRLTQLALTNPLNHPTKISFSDAKTLTLTLNLTLLYILIKLDIYLVFLLL